MSKAAETAASENLPVSYAEQLAAEAAALKQTISAPSSNTISTKGKMFTLPDGTTNPGPMSVVILDYTSFNSMFEGAYDPNQPQSPVCWAVNKNIGELAPSADAPKPQGETCATCPKNQWGSAATGRGKACKNTRRLSIVPANANPETQPMTLNVSPTGLKAFDAYVSKLGRELGAVPIQVVTQIGFDPNQAYPTLTFSEPALHDNLSVMFGLRPLAQEMLAREPDVTK